MQVHVRMYVCMSMVYINDEDGIYKCIVCVLHFIQHICTYVVTYVLWVCTVFMYIFYNMYVCMLYVYMYVQYMYILVRVIGTYVCCTQVEVPVEQLSM